MYEWVIGKSLQLQECFSDVILDQWKCILVGKVDRCSVDV